MTRIPRILRSWAPVGVLLASVPASAIAQVPDLPADAAGPQGAVRNPGFRVRSAQAPEFSELPNTLTRAIRQLNGTLTDPGGALIEDEVQAGPNADGGFDVSVINFEKDANPDVSDGTLHPDDELFPGIPGTGGHTTEFATEVLAYIPLAAGEHTFGAEVWIERIDAPGGSDDDSVEVFVGTNPRDFFSDLIATFQRDPNLTFVSQAQPWEFTFNVPVAGVYPFRFVYRNRTGGATLALYDADGLALLNDLGSSVTTYRDSQAPIHGHAYVAEVSPLPGSAGVPADVPVVVRIFDDATTVAVDDVAVTFNGADVTAQAVIAKEDGRMTVTYQPPTSRQSERNDLGLVFMDSAGAEHVREWSFASVQGVREPKVACQWDFSGGLQATVGPDLEYKDGPNGSTADGTMFGTTESFGIADIDGQVADVMLVPGTPGWDIGYRVAHGIAPNGGGAYVNQYTLIMDVMKVGGGGASAIIQATPTRYTADASFFWQGSNMGQGGGGYNGLGMFTSDEWHRIAFAVDLAANPPRITKWVDGVNQDPPFWQQQSLDQTRRALEPTIVFFNDSDERSEWFVNSIQLWDGFLSDEQMEALGGPTADGLEPPNVEGLRFTAVEVAEDGSVTVTWISRPNRSYAVDYSPDLETWLELTDGYPSQGDRTSFTETSETIGDDAERRYYRVREE